MIKTNICPKCNGFGFVMHGGTKSILSSPCNMCGTLGHTTASMTNYDVFMSMSPEKLAKHIPCPYGECKFGWHKPIQTCEECIIEWLNSPAKEKYYELNEDK